MSAFTAAVERFVVQENARVEAYCRGVALTLFGMIIDRTPVLRGRLRGDWRTNVGSPNYETRTVDASIAEGDPSPSVAASLEDAARKELAAAVDSWETDRPLFFTNNLPYARRIEEEGHSSVKAPAGMVMVSVADMKAAMGGGK